MQMKQFYVSAYTRNAIDIQEEFAFNASLKIYTNMENNQLNKI